MFRKDPRSYLKWNFWAWGSFIGTSGHVPEKRYYYSNPQEQQKGKNGTNLKRNTDTFSSEFWGDFLIL